MHQGDVTPWRLWIEMSAPDPQLLAAALSELIALRGYARSHADRELQETWGRVADESWAASTTPIKISRGVLYVDVRSSALLGELNSFHRPELTTRFQQLAPHLRVKSIKFRLTR